MVKALVVESNNKGERMNTIVYFLTATSILNLNIPKPIGADTDGGKVQNSYKYSCHSQKYSDGDGGGGLHVGKIDVLGEGILVGGGGGGKTTIRFHAISGEGSQGGGGFQDVNGGDLGGGLMIDNIGIDGGGKYNEVEEGSSGGGPQIYCEGLNKSGGDGDLGGGPSIVSIVVGPEVGGGGGGAINNNTNGVGGGH